MVRANIQPTAWSTARMWMETATRSTKTCSLRSVSSIDSIMRPNPLRLPLKVRNFNRRTPFATLTRQTRRSRFSVPAAVKVVSSFSRYNLKGRLCRPQRKISGIHAESLSASGIRDVCRM